MAFYLSLNGNINLHHFDYLESNSINRRLEPTLTPRIQKSVEQKSILSKKIITCSVSEIMNRNLVSISPDSPVKDAIELLKKHSIHHLAVMSNNNFKGILSDRDVLWLEKVNLAQNFTVKDSMSSIVLLSDENSPLDHLASVFYHEKIHAMPVVDSDQSISGIVSQIDIIKWVFDNH